MSHKHAVVDFDLSSGNLSIGFYYFDSKKLLPSQEIVRHLTPHSPIKHQTFVYKYGLNKQQIAC